MLILLLMSLAVECESNTFSSIFVQYVIYEFGSIFSLSFFFITLIYKGWTSGSDNNSSVMFFNVRILGCAVQLSSTRITDRELGSNSLSHFTNLRLICVGHLGVEPSNKSFTIFIIFCNPSTKSTRSSMHLLLAWYSAGTLSMLIFLKHLGFWLLPMTRSFFFYRCPTCLRIVKELS